MFTGKKLDAIQQRELFNLTTSLGTLFHRVGSLHQKIDSEKCSPLHSAVLRIDEYERMLFGTERKFKETLREVEALLFARKKTSKKKGAE